MIVRHHAFGLTVLMVLAACAAQEKNQARAVPPTQAVVSVSASASAAPTPCVNDRPVPSARLWCHKSLPSCEVNALTEPILWKLDQHPKRDELSLTFVDGATDAGLATVVRAPWVKAISVNLRWVSNLSPLSKLKELRTLHVKGVEVETSLDFLRQLKQLEELEIEGDIGDARPLESLVQLKRLRVNDPAPVLAVISRLPSLTELRLSHLSSDGPLDITLLAGATHLVRLDLSFIEVKSYGPIGALTQLEHLRLAYSEVSDLTPLGKLSQLRELDISACSRVTSFVPLQALSKLEELDVSATRISDLTPVASLPSLKKLDISNTKVTSLAPLAKHCVLEELNANETLTSDIAALANCPALLDINLHATPLTSIAPLAKLSSVQVLDIGETGVRDLSPLFKIPSLVLLHAPREIKTTEIQALKKANKGIEVKQTDH